MRLRGPMAPIMKTHPLSGLPIEPLGMVNGRLIYPIMGGAPDDDDDDDDDKGGGNDRGDAGSDGDDKDKDSNSGGDSKTVSWEEFERLRERMQAADRRAAEAEKKVKDAEDAKKDDLTKAQDRVTELEQEIEQREERIRSLTLQNAFLTANEHSWHEPETALSLAESNGYLDGVVSDEGDVDKTRLKKALDRLAKEKKFLVQETKGEKDDEPPASSGEPAGGRSDNSKDDRAKKEQLRRRFPVLNR
jgi:hypothetical protein